MVGIQDGFKAITYEEKRREREKGIKEDEGAHKGRHGAVARKKKLMVLFMQDHTSEPCQSSC